MQFTVSGRVSRSATCIGLLYDYDCPFPPQRLPLSTRRTKKMLNWLQKKAEARLSQYLAGVWTGALKMRRGSSRRWKHTFGEVKTTSESHKQREDQREHRKTWHWTHPGVRDNNDRLTGSVSSQAYFIDAFGPTSVVPSGVRNRPDQFSTR